MESTEESVDHDERREPQVREGLAIMSVDPCEKCAILNGMVCVKSLSMHFAWVIRQDRVRKVAWNHMGERM